MSITLIIYLMEVFGKLNEVATFVFIASSVLLLLAIFMADTEKEIERLHQCRSAFLVTIAISALLAFFTPSEKTMYVMLGASYLKDSNLPPKIDAALEKKLDGYLSETTKENKHD